MSKKNNYKKFSIPRNLIFISTIILTVLVFFFVWFGVTYNQNKVKVFAEDLAEVDYKKINPDELDDFTFEFYCSDYFATSKSKAVFLCTAYDKAKDNGKVTNVKVKLMLAANWIGYTSSSTSGTLKDSENWWDSQNHEEDDTDPYAKTKATLSISGVTETFPKKSFFFGMKVQPKAYVWLSYSLTKNGKTTDHNYLIKYDYNDYYTNDTL